MKAASLKEIKTELAGLNPSKILDLCMHLAKYKKENKELMTYLLFEAHDEQQYKKEIKEELNDLFKDVNKSSVFLAKKTVRKILRITNKYIKYSGNKQTEVELLLFFSKKLRKAGLPLHANTVLGNIYLRQTVRIKKALATLHEDLQYDYEEEMTLLFS